MASAIIESETVQLETARCLCGSSEPPTRRIPARDYVTGRIFTYWRCGLCGLDYLNPRPRREAISVYYPTNYYAYANAYSDPGRLRRWFDHALYAIYYAPSDASPFWLRLIWLPLALVLFPLRRCSVLAFRPPRQKSLFEFGAAVGKDLETFRSMGWQVGGCEPSAAACDLARNKGFAIQCMSAEAVTLPTNGYSCILLNNVFEHVYDPSLILTKCRQALQDDGALILIVPNHASLSANLLRGYWVGYDGPRHLWGFSPRTLRDLLTQHGFHIEYIQQRPALRWAWFSAFVNILADCGVSGHLRRFASHLLAILALPFAFFAAVVGRADFIKVVARPAPQHFG
jgi:SAM-dependent methyltransferase